MKRFGKSSYLSLLGFVAFVYSSHSFGSESDDGEPSKATLLSKQEQKIVGKWYCKNSSSKATFVFYETGNYEKQSELYGRKVIDKGIWEITRKKLHLARLVHISDGESSSTNIVFTRDIQKISSDTIQLQHEGGLGNIVKTKCGKTKGLFWWF